MSISVELTYDMSKALGVRHFEVNGARTVQDVMRLTRDQFGAERADAFEKLTRVAAVAVNGVLVNHTRGMKTALADGDTVTFLKAAAGG
jgi:molybdopterin converting factor small subunit